MFCVLKTLLTLFLVIFDFRAAGTVQAMAVRKLQARHAILQRCNRGEQHLGRIHGWWRKALTVSAFVSKIA